MTFQIRTRTSRDLDECQHCGFPCQHTTWILLERCEPIGVFCSLTCAQREEARIETDRLHSLFFLA